MKEIILMEASLRQVDGYKEIFYGVSLLGQETLLGTYQENDEDYMVTKKEEQINLRRFLEDSSKTVYIVEQEAMKLSDREQETLNERIQELMEKNYPLELLGSGNSKELMTENIQCLPKEKFDYLSKLKHKKPQTSFGDLLYIDSLERKVAELYSKVNALEEATTPPSRH